MEINMECNRLLKSYRCIIEDWLVENESVRDLLTRGLVVCINDKVRHPLLLLSGINPSFDEKENNRQDILFLFAEAKDYGRSKYWSKKHNQFGGKGSELVKNNMAYIDLFPLKESDQIKFERILRVHNDLRMSLLLETQKEIERLNPKLIVHANKSSLYYWGLNPSTYKKDDVNKWLNYNFEEISLGDCPPLRSYSQRIDFVPKEKRFVHLYRISGNGFCDGNHYFLSYIMEYFGMKDWQKVQLLSSTEMNNLWDWCMDN